jgi:penicillin-insensitive murein endopeptidase
MPGSRVVIVALGALGMSAAACTHLGVVGDNTSVSIGRTNQGLVLDPVRMPDDGDGFWSPPIWKTRGNRWGTDELVDLVVGAGRRVAAVYPGARLGVGDLSPIGGRSSAGHKSHQSGRDVDLVLYQTDLAGKPIASDTMRRFADDGTARDGAAKFDVARNWVLVRALVTAPEAEVQRIFLYEPLALMLLDHARAIGEPDAILAVARDALKQPGDSAPHDDHMHVRIYCSAADVAYGCTDAGDLDDQDKPPPAMAALDPAMRRWLAMPMPAMLALVGWSMLR